MPMPVNTGWVKADFAPPVIETLTLPGNKPQSIVFFLAERSMRMISDATTAVTFEKQPYAKILPRHRLLETWVHLQRFINAMTGFIRHNRLELGRINVRACKRAFCGATALLWGCSLWLRHLRLECDDRRRGENGGEIHSPWKPQRLDSWADLITVEQCDAVAEGDIPCESAQEGNVSRVMGDSQQHVLTPRTRNVEAKNICVRVSCACSTKARRHSSQPRTTYL